MLSVDGPLTEKSNIRADQLFDLAFTQTDTVNDPLKKTPAGTQ